MPHFHMVLKKLVEYGVKIDFLIFWIVCESVQTTVYLNHI